MKTGSKSFLRALEDAVDTLWAIGAVIAVALVAGALVFAAYTMVEREARTVFAQVIELQHGQVRP